MEDALISPLGFMILTGAGLIEAKNGAPIQIHTTDTIGKGEVQTDLAQGKFWIDSPAEGEVKTVVIPVSEKEPVSAKEPKAYVMPLKNGEIFTEPFIGIVDTKEGSAMKGMICVGPDYVSNYTATDIAKFLEADAVLIDYYTDKESGAQQIEITADKFGGNYYIEASTLFRNTDGVDMPAEFIIPNAKVQSNFTFTMASSGDPSTFTFTMDAFPDYTRFDKTKKVLMAIQIIGEADSESAAVRKSTDNSHTDVDDVDYVKA
jgi:hypothetical protein